MTFARENDFDSLIRDAAKRHAVPFALIKAIIAAESGFRPDAIRGEPHLADASRGLMQVLYSTAIGTGYKGEPSGLFEPRANIDAGTSYLASLLSKTGNVAGAASAYNGGYRPSYAFGVPATAAVAAEIAGWNPPGLCLARDAAGKCVRRFSPKVGQYGNQEYVDKVMGYFRDFGGVDFSDVTSGGSSTAAPLVLPPKPDIPAVDLSGVEPISTDFRTGLKDIGQRYDNALTTAERVWYALVIVGGILALVLVRAKGG